MRFVKNASGRDFRRRSFPPLDIGGIIHYNEIKRKKAGIEMGKIKEKFENYWYYYKYPTLLGLLVLIISIAALVQCASADEYDLCITYAGPYSMSDAELDVASYDCASALGRDLTGDGKVQVSFNNIYYMTADQIRAALTKNPNFVVKDEVLKTNLESFDREFAAGDTVIWLVDPALYDRFAKTDDWVSMLEVVDAELWRSLTAELPDGAFDQYSIRLSETAFGKLYFSYLPEDTLLCMRRSSNYTALMGQTESGEQYDRGAEALREILSFGR